jgi:hypothetical protein
MLAVVADVQGENVMGRGRHVVHVDMLLANTAILIEDIDGDGLRESELIEQLLDLVLVLGHAWHEQTGIGKGWLVMLLCARPQ